MLACPPAPRPPCSGEELRQLVVDKWGVSYDVTLQVGAGAVRLLRTGPAALPLLAGSLPLPTQLPPAPSPSACAAARAASVPARDVVRWGAGGALPAPALPPPPAAAAPAAPSAARPAAAAAAPAGATWSSRASR